MRYHDMRLIPNIDTYRTQTHCDKSVNYACINCGIWDVSLAHGAPVDCDEILRDNSNTAYFPGGSKDPFASQRGLQPRHIINHALSGGACGGQGVSIGVTGGGGYVYMGGGGGCESGSGITHIIMDECAAEPKEDIPGLTPETIDKDAYDSFMKGL